MSKIPLKVSEIHNVCYEAVNIIEDNDDDIRLAKKKATAQVDEPKKLTRNQRRKKNRQKKYDKK